MESYELHLGNCLQVLKTLPSNSIDSIVTDPPYGLAFMGSTWDGSNGFRRSLNEADSSRDNAFGHLSRGAPEYRAGVVFQEFCEQWATEALRVLKPGGHMLAFGGARTYQRMACGVEDAGFTIRDQIMWVYGSGMPKSHNLKGEHQGWGTALKPAHEPIVVARKPLIGTVAQNVLEFGTGALNIDASRVEHVSVGDDNLALHPHLRTPINGDKGGNILAHEGDRHVVTPNQPGRWPANLIHDGSDEVLEAFPEAPRQFADVSTSAPSGRSKNVSGRMRRDGEASAAKRYTDEGSTNFAALPGQRRFDTGSAARFFYCAKASKSERGPGNDWPTVKPLKLMAYLCRLVTPPGGVVLDPFLGSGSTGVAAVTLGYRFIGVDSDQHAYEIAAKRLAALVLEVPAKQPQVGAIA
jgi:DNA modification methylase